MKSFPSSIPIQQIMKVISTVWILLIVSIAVLPAPYVTPFANAGPASSSSSPSSSSHVVAHQLLQPQQQQQHQSSLLTTSTPPISTSGRRSNSVILSNTVQSVMHDEKGNEVTILQKFRNYTSRMFKRTSVTTNSTTLYTKKNNNFISQLFFNYVVPLLQLASIRQLTVEDALLFQNSNNNNDLATMDTNNSNNLHQLQQIYDRLTEREFQHQQQIEFNDTTMSVTTNTSTITTSVNATAAPLRRRPPMKSSTILLTQALLQHQRRFLIVTGMLRLTNTIVQAFPSILVAKLLRSIEAGTAQPIQTSLLTATTLVTILSIKMILENQYFHYLVKSSTNIRDNLASMIFNKSLRLQQGGSNTIRNDVLTNMPTIQSDDNTVLNQTITADGSNNKEITSGTSSSSSTPATTLGVGGVITLMQSDTSIIESAAMQFHTIWDGPLQIAIYTTLLFRYLGPSVLYGMAVLLLTIPVNSVALRILNRLSRYENEAKDARTKRTTESISHMKLLKLQNWEQQFAADIRFHRQKELQHFVSRGFIRAANSAISNAIPAVVLVVTLTAYVRTGRPIVASTIFTAISLFNQLRFPLFFYPLLIDSIANGRNAMRRISTFLSAKEVVPYVQYILDGETGGSIEMRNGNFLWSMSQESSISTEGVDNDKSPVEDTLSLPALSNVNIKINPGEVVAVIGSVGSGKSALIKGMLGELNPIIPEAISTMQHDQPKDSVVNYPLVISHGHIAYCSQEAWLPKGTLREAITFGREYDDERYMRAIYDAGLDEDIASVPNNISAPTSSISASNGGALRHDTDVGEGGSSLSGGQRARVSLARALYSGDDTKVFLLDDCLAALDTRVGSTVFDRMTRRLRKSKAATVLVTNDPSIPRRCNRVILMGSVPGSTSSSTIIDVGTYDELLSRGHDLRGISTSEDIIEEANIDIGFTASFNDTSTHMATSAPTPIINTGMSESNIDESVDCSYGDCETQLTMQNCPDFIADQVGTTRRSSNDDDYVLIDHVCVSKDSTPSFNDTNSRVSQLAHAVPGAMIPIPQHASVQTTSKTISSVDDSMSVGAVPRSIYLLYLKSVGSPLLVIAMFASYILSNGAQFYQQYTVAKWTEVGADAMGSAVGLGYLNRLVYAAGVVSVFLWIRSVLTMQVGVRASSFLHSRMLSSVFAAPMSFFDVTPSGQLLSRFGKEIETVDKGVPDSIGSVLFCFLQIFLSAGALAGILSSGMAIPLALVAVLYVRMMARFRPAARDMKRVETKTRSPIYTNFGEAIRGAETIRSIQGASAYWSHRHQSLFDTNLRVYFTVKALDRWLSTRLETLGNVVVFASAVASVILTRSGQLKAGSAGWGLTQALSVTGLLTWAVRCLTDLESNMMSVMRVKELTDLESESVDLSVATHSKRNSPMPKELSHHGDAFVPLLSDANEAVNATIDPLQRGEALVKSGWPWLGNVEFRNVSMRYTPDAPLVLKDLTLSVPAGTTLGIVGRSGSGKSSLLLTLFRLAEIENGLGSIQIDGVDVRSVGIATLRQSLAIIPQDPFLFTGTLAYNLDATGKASEAEMLQALEITSPELAASFRRANGLNTIISNSLLSVGERQLICLARALLRKSKILVLDEATSSVDSKTDQKVQETIRRQFVDRGVTVITVAHRLDTVLSYDRIAVLGDGKLLEYGPPAKLISNPGGELQKLVLADRLSKLKGGKKSAKNADESNLVKI